MRNVMRIDRALGEKIQQNPFLRHVYVPLARGIGSSESSTMVDKMIDEKFFLVLRKVMCSPFTHKLRQHEIIYETINTTYTHHQLHT